MADLIENEDRGTGPGKLAAGTLVAPQEGFVNDVYALLDEAIACGLDRLRSEEGVIPACQSGCCHCCRYHIVTNIAEARTLVHYINREFSADQVENLRERTRQWHEWDTSRRGGDPSSTSDTRSDHSGHDHSCPLLADGECSAYPVRPVVCRTHFVSSDPRFCRAANDPDATEEAPVVLSSLVTAARPFSEAMREHVEEAGLDFSRTTMLLPHWLAIEMGWDFALSR